MSTDINQVGNLEYLWELVENYKDAQKHEYKELSLDWFFTMALLPYYDVMWTGLRPEVGHLLYRLSDRVPEQERKDTEIYPASGSEGSIIDQDGGRWHSLEDWRASWKKAHPIIPEVTLLLPDMTLDE